MPATYEPIATTTLGSEASSIVFSSIPATYTDLRLVMVGIKPSATNSAPRVQFNTDTGSSTNYSYTQIQGNGSAASSAAATNDGGIPLIIFDALVSTTPKLGTLDILNYRGSTNKTCLNFESSDRNGSGRVVLAVGMWRNTAAITTITINDNSSRNFGVGTTATLYGILRA
jgi:hypothetical protein